MTSSASTARALLADLADAWNRGDAAAGANCFAVDAVYLEPPDRQHTPSSAATSPNPAL